MAKAKKGAPKQKEPLIGEDELDVWALTLYEHKLFSKIPKGFHTDLHNILEKHGIQKIIGVPMAIIEMSIAECLATAYRDLIMNEISGIPGFDTKGDNSSTKALWKICRETKKIKEASLKRHQAMKPDSTGKWEKIRL